VSIHFEVIKITKRTYKENSRHDFWLLQRSGNIGRETSRRGGKWLLFSINSFGWACNITLTKVYTANRQSRCWCHLKNNNEKNSRQEAKKKKTNKQSMMTLCEHLRVHPEVCWDVTCVTHFHTEHRKGRLSTILPPPVVELRFIGDVVSNALLMSDRDGKINKKIKT
jgi:hypothetical protein